MGWRIPFKANGDYNQQKKSSDSIVVGLQILIHLSNGDSNCILVKSKLKFNKKPNSRRNLIPSMSTTTTTTTPDQYYSCFLKSCFLCNKTLCHDKDVYMYRGDEGFCSEECRSRQIYVDEIKEIEISTKKMIASYRKSLYSGGGGGRCEANILQEELRHHHKTLPRKQRAIFL